MPLFKNTLQTKLYLDRLPEGRGKLIYNVEGLGAVTPNGIPQNLIEIPEQHLGLPGIKNALEQKWLVPFAGLKSEDFKPKSAHVVEAPKVEVKIEVKSEVKSEPVPDLTKTISESVEEAKLATPVVEEKKDNILSEMKAAMEETPSHETKAEKRARRQREQQGNSGSEQ